MLKGTRPLSDPTSPQQSRLAALEASTKLTDSPFNVPWTLKESARIPCLGIQTLLSNFFSGTPVEANAHISRRLSWVSLLLKHIGATYTCPYPQFPRGLPPIALERSVESPRAFLLRLRTSLQNCKTSWVSYLV